MNILYIITSYPPSIGGAQLHLHYLAKIFSQKHNVEVITQLNNTAEKWLFDTTLFAPLKNRNYCMSYVPVRQLNFSLAERAILFPFVLPYYVAQNTCADIIAQFIMRKINDRVMMDKIDIVHSSKIGREYLSLAALKLARHLKVPFVFTPNHHPRWQGWIHRAYLHLCKNTDVLIALTENEKQRFIQLGVDKNKIHVTGIGPIISEKYNAAQFKTKYNINDRMILFLGQKNTYKGFDILIKAANIVWKKYPSAKFVFIGPRTNYSKKIFEQTKHNSNIIEIGSVSLEEKTSALAACDILCLLSSQESFGGVFLETWSFNKPVIGRDIYAIREVIEDGKDGFIVKRDSREIASKIIQLLDDPVLRENMGKCGHEKVKKKYNWNNIANLTEQVYESLV